MPAASVALGNEAVVESISVGGVSVTTLATRRPANTEEESAAGNTLRP